MKGKDLLNECPQEVKDLIVAHFESLEKFYGYAFSVGARQYKKFIKTKQFDLTDSDPLKKYLQNIGIDESLSDDLVDEIANDFDEIMVETRLRQTLGDNWKDKISAIENMLNSKNSFL